MSRIAFSLVLCGPILWAGSGCSHFLETRAIKGWTQALVTEDLDGLKRTSSDHFEHKALRLTESLDDLRILHLPTKEPSVVEVEDESENVKRVTVQFGESSRKLLYKLVREPETDKWVVDDIYVRQKKKGLRTTKSVTEQMNLLLTLREFLATWQTGSRDDVIAVTTPEFGQLLGELSPIYLSRLTKQVAGKKSRSSKLKPEAQMDKSVAIVRLPRTAGDLVISFKLQAESWKVDDVAVESKIDEEHIASVRKTATVILAAEQFLTGYSENDKQQLLKVSTGKFFNTCIAPADLSLVNLPEGQTPQSDYQVKTQGKHATFIIPTPTEIVQIGLVRTDNDDPDKPIEYLVEEVTLHERDGSQVKRLSSLFTAHARMHVFSEALAKRNLTILKQSATPDFNSRVWNNLDKEMLQEIPLTGIEDAAPRVVSTVFQGPITEITVSQGNRPLTYVLRHWNGKLLIDDVIVPLPKLPNSLKSKLEMVIPIYDFALGVHTADISMLQRNSSNHFNRLIWKQFDYVPDVGFEVAKHLRAPLASVKPIGTDKMQVRLGDNRYGADILLVTEHDHYVVDEILLVAGPQLEQRAQLKATLRQLLASGIPTRLRTFQTSSNTRLQPVPKRSAAAIRSAVDFPVRLPQTLNQTQRTPRSAIRPVAGTQGDLPPLELDSSSFNTVN